MKHTELMESMEADLKKLGQGEPNVGSDCCGHCVQAKKALCDPPAGVELLSWGECMTKVLCSCCGSQGEQEAPKGEGGAGGGMWASPPTLSEPVYAQAAVK